MTKIDRPLLNDRLHKIHISIRVLPANGYTVLFFFASAFARYCRNVLISVSFSIFPSHNKGNNSDGNARAWHISKPYSNLNSAPLLFISTFTMHFKYGFFKLSTSPLALLLLELILMLRACLQIILSHFFFNFLQIIFESIEFDCDYLFISSSLQCAEF